MSTRRSCKRVRTTCTSKTVTSFGASSGILPSSLLSKWHRRMRVAASCATSRKMRLALNLCTFPLHLSPLASSLASSISFFPRTTILRGKIYAAKRVSIICNSSSSSKGFLIKEIRCSSISCTGLLALISRTGVAQSSSLS